MFREIRLKPIVEHDGELQFEWDPDLGVFRGRDGDKVRELADEAVQRGTVISHPWPTPYDIDDPARNAADLAVVLGRHWILDSDLAASHPTEKDDAPEGALH